MLKKLMSNFIVKKLTNLSKPKPTKAERRKKKYTIRKRKLEFTNHMLCEFGSFRYHLSKWFGSWILYTCNPGFYNSCDTISNCKIVNLNSYKTSQFIKRLYGRS